jgi:outer membrane protein OmpA-like peptidoglycan-associated protein
MVRLIFWSIKMSNQQDDNQTVVWAILIPVIVLVIGLAVGVGVSKTLKKPSPAVPAVVDTASAPPALALSADESAVRVENGIVKFYFAPGKADLAVGAKEALADVVQAAAQGKTLVLSGFHDSTGSAELNAELAKQRALSVKAALLELGVSDAKMSLKKPESIEQTAGADAQARRVEVSIE